MATDDERAEKDLQDKRALEVELVPILRRIEKELTREFARGLDATGTVPNLRAIQIEALEPELLRHYEVVADVFSRRIELEETREERAKIGAALLLFFVQTAPQQANAIATTTQRHAGEALRTARELADGAALTERQIARDAASIFARRQAGRTGGIATFETQLSAETAKLTQVEVLLGGEPSITGGGGTPLPGVVQATKTWVTKGDDRVRDRPDFSHVDAGGQVVLANAAFTVSGERLKYPGDTALGASNGNVLGCRCSAVYKGVARR